MTNYESHLDILKLVDNVTDEHLRKDIMFMESMNHNKFLWVWDKGSTTVIPLELGLSMQYFEAVSSPFSAYLILDQGRVKRINRDSARIAMEVSPPVTISADNTTDEIFESIDTLLSKSPATCTLKLPKVQTSNIAEIMIKLTRTGKVRVLRFINETLEKGGLLKPL
ncbi:hypothetical protein A1QO_00800 [Vibrio genomosp. F10 str. ZF-129]|uniref:Uncharacterized protein n=1 Tax=Vibrio genomosp. F10 str. ZF-129 TaxID=1187848 RepID=A0A1E5BGC9_9VIBR|nr:hypothetical protein [Vibrio genomosp. F10]OEE35331.1 hypothetical protein A1QO_00800 [Vibrio genomosp. F10 str. ZF-129]